MLPDKSPLELLAGAISKLCVLGLRSRELTSEILRNTLKSRPDCFAVWMAWETDAVDGRDRQYRDVPGSDRDGRFVPYWHRAFGTIKLGSLRGYDLRGEGDWYSFLKRQGRLCKIDKPFLYPVDDQPFWVVSEFAPLVVRGTFVGAVGIDHAAAPSARRENAFTPAVCVLGQSIIAEKLQTLTSREREVHYWVSQGKTNDEIAAILGISANTVKNHLSPIFQKLGVENRYAAALLQA